MSPLLPFFPFSPPYVFYLLTRFTIYELADEFSARGEGKHQTWSRDIDEDDLSPAPDT